MAKYHNIRVNGMNWCEYAYDLVVNQNKSIEDATDELCYGEFGMPEGTAESIAQNIAWNIGNVRDELAQQIAQRLERERLASMPWQQHPATKAQCDYLRALGLETLPAGLTKLQASKLIDALKEQQDDELNQAADEFVQAVLSS